MARRLGAGSTLLCGKSWINYVGLLLGGLIVLAIAVFAYSVEPLLGIGIGILFGTSIIYRWLLLRSEILYMDDSGVWMRRGILPWKKTSLGVKWRDLDEAVYTQNFKGWLFRSHSLIIKHRYTKANEIVLREMHCGHNATGKINAMHGELLRQGRLD